MSSRLDTASLQTVYSLPSWRWDHVLMWSVSTFGMSSKSGMWSLRSHKQIQHIVIVHCPGMCMD